MPIKNRIADLHDDMTGWRQHLHAHPELAFQEHETSAFIASQLESFGIEVRKGFAGTGLVGVLKGNGDSERMIGLRADFDALPLTEKTGLPHASKHDGRMHACGHDGHTTMLLGAAKYLAETRNFAGSVAFIFQPAEENGGGAKVMMDDGLFREFPVESVWGMHNSPLVAAGKIAYRTGQSMAAVDDFTIDIGGRGGHAARPQQSVDPIMIGVQLYSAIQTIVSRQVDPIASAVISVTQFHGGSAYNIIPDDARLCGTVRTFDPEVRALVEKRMRAACVAVSAQYEVPVSLSYDRGYPALVNSEAETRRAAEIAERVAGLENVVAEVPPVMGGEDFSYMLLEKPGSYIWIGQKDEAHQASLHNPHYDFNDAILPLGASYFAELVEDVLSRP